MNRSLLATALRRCPAVVGAAAAAPVTVAGLDDAAPPGAPVS